MTLNVLFIDNFDSFVFNLVDEFERLGSNVDVWRNDTPVEKSLELLEKMAAPKLLVISPGPGTPKTAGNNIELIKSIPNDLPVFGICLGHQIIVEAFGGIVGGANEIVHGKPDQIEHNGKGIYEGLENPITAGRYHSLIGTKIPDKLRVNAKIGDMAMGVEHVSRNIVGVQFHPESILTPFGGKLIENVISLAKT